MAPKTYECYVSLSHVHRNGHLVPAVGAFRANDTEYLPSGDWHDLVTNGTLVIWRVERTMVSHAKDLVLAHLAGHAPHGITKLYDRSRPEEGA
jgi:hypothetical protein